MNVDYALMVEPQLGGTYDELAECARWAEDRGMVAFARSDHYGWMGDEPTDATDAFATLGGLARETSTIRLAVLVSPITFRHPAVIAKNAATVDQMSGGRLDLGVGTGWMEAEHEAFGLPFPPWSERFARLEESLGYLRAAFGEGRGRFEGAYYRLDADVRPKPTGGMPIIIGGSGPRRTPTLAGRFADEYNHFYTAAEDLAPKIGVLRAAAESAGRDPETITISVMGTAITGRDPAEYRANLEAQAAWRGVDPDEFETRARARGIPMGTREEVEAAFAPLAELGVTKWYLQHLDVPIAADVERAFGALLD